jgi:hypothetical protein
MTTIIEAQKDKKHLEVEIMKLIAEYQQKHVGLRVECVSITTTKVNGYPPIQNTEINVVID